MRKFEMTYIYKGGEQTTIAIEANNRIEAIKKFREMLGIKNISVLDYFFDRDITESEKIYTADHETGTFIEECDSIEEAIIKIAEYERQDRADGTYEADFYDVVDENHVSLM